MTMKKNKPKGKTPSLIGLSNGRPVRAIAKKKSHCQRCGCDIICGQDCFEIPKFEAGFSTPKRYCRECFQNILDQTYRDLEDIKNL